MRDMKPCQHTLSDDVLYKEVVVIGNGPSGMVTSFMLAGNVPYLKRVPDDLPIDDMLKARLQNLPPGQNLLEADLVELAEGLEGRSQNPIPLLNSPLYIGGTGNDTSTDNELSRQWLVHTALDALEERLSSTNITNINSGTNTSRTELRDLYLGLLYSTDTHKIYGYVTNTRIKLVLVTSSTSPSGSNIRDAEVRGALRRLHALYADAICNPFHLPGDQITSTKFDKQVKSLIMNNV